MPRGKLSRMEWVFHKDHGVGEVRFREGARVRADFSGTSLTVSDGFRTVPDASSWVLAGQDPDRLLQLLREDPGWVVREQLVDTCGRVTVGEISEHLSSIGLVAVDVADWHDLISASLDSSDSPRSAQVGGSLVFSPDDEDPKVLGARLRGAFNDLADPDSTDVERLLSIRRLENLAQRTSVSAGEAVVARILGCSGFDDSTPLPKIRLTGFGNQLFTNLLGRCETAKDIVILALISSTTSQAKLAAAAVGGEDRTVLEEFFVELLDDVGNSLSSDERSEGEPTNSEIRRILSRIALLNETPPSSVVAAMLKVRATATDPRMKPMAKAVDGFINDMRPTVEVLRIAVESTSGLPAELRTACLNSLPFEPESIRVLYLEALLDISGPTLLNTQEPWEKVTTRELASGWPDSHPVLTAMIESDCGQKVATATIRKDVDRMDPERLGLLLALRPDVRALVPDELFVKALERLGRRNPNVAQLPNLVAQPYIKEAHEELQRQKSVLEDQHRTLEVELGKQVADRDSQITELERELKQARSRIASRTNEVRRAHAAELRQAVVETLKDCAQMVANLQKGDGNEDVLRKLEHALEGPGLVILDRPGEIVTFDPARHERLGRGSSHEVEVVLSAIGYTEGDSVTVISRGSVRTSG